MTTRKQQAEQLKQDRDDMKRRLKDLVTWTMTAQDPRKQLEVKLNGLEPLLDGWLSFNTDKAKQRFYRNNVQFTGEQLDEVGDTSWLLHEAVKTLPACSQRSRMAMVWLVSYGHSYQRAADEVRCKFSIRRLGRHAARNWYNMVVNRMIEMEG